MTRFGDFLERFYGPHETFQAVRASVQSRFQDISPNAPRSAIGRPNQDFKQQDSKTDLQMWVNVRSSKYRLGSKTEIDEEIKTRTEVNDGETQWRRFLDGTVESGACDEIEFPTDYERHFDRNLIRQFFANLEMRWIQDCEYIGRECVRVRATSVADAMIWPHWLPPGADEYEFILDLEKAVLLSITAVISGHWFERINVLDVEFDPDIPDSVFNFELKAGETAKSRVPISEHLSIEDAQSRVSFDVLVPTWLPDPTPVRNSVIYHPAIRSMPERIVIFYIGNGASLHFRLGSEPDLTHEEFVWETVEIDGKELEISDRGAGTRVVAFQQNGTHVQLNSEMNREDLLKVAASFEKFV